MKSLTIPLLLIALPAAAQQVPTCTVTTQPTESTGPANVQVTWSVTDAVLCVASGRWSGPKDCAGGTVTIQGVTETAEFKLNAKAATGKATAKWTKPVQNEDGTPTTISGFKLYVADSVAQVPTATPISLPATTLEHILWRPPGNVSVGVAAIRADNVASAMSNIGSKTVVVAQANCSATVTIKPRPKAPSLTLTWLKELLSRFDRTQNST